MTEFLIAVILLLLLALTGALTAWYRTADRADRAELKLAEDRRRANLHMAEARRMLRDAQVDTSAEVRRNAAEARHFAEVPRDGQIRTVDDFLNDLFGGR